MFFDFIRVKLFEGLSKELLKKKKQKVEREKKIFYFTLAEASTKIKEFFPSFFFFIAFVIFYMIYVFFCRKILMILTCYIA